jgi:hypothetical protein
LEAEYTVHLTEAQSAHDEVFMGLGRLLQVGECVSVALSSGFRGKGFIANVGETTHSGLYVVTVRLVGIGPLET